MTFTRRVKDSIKSMVNGAGWEIRRYDPSSSVSLRLVTILRHLNIKLVLDVGANVGQYAQSIRKSGYTDRIVSFEPLPDAHRQLLRNARGDKLWSVHPRCALGAELGEVQINVSKNSVSSSIRAMLPSHLQAEPQSAYISSERTSLVTLDSVFPSYRHLTEATWLKVDTQGSEKEVLEGAVLSMPDIKAVQLELSLVPLYEGQSLWEEFLVRMQGWGYEVWALLPGFCDMRTGRSLQVDAIFVRV